eukprot:tig00000057_g79.t1
MVESEESGQALLDTVGALPPLEVAIAKFIQNHMGDVDTLPHRAAVIKTVNIPAVIDASNIEEVVKTVGLAYQALPAEEQRVVAKELVTAISIAAPAVAEAVGAVPDVSVAEEEVVYGNDYDDDLDLQEANLAADTAAATADVDGADFGGF